MSNIVVFIILILSFIFWKLRSYIKRIVKAKLEKTVSNFEEDNDATNSERYENNNEPQGRL